MTLQFQSHYHFDLSHLVEFWKKRNKMIQGEVG